MNEALKTKKKLNKKIRNVIIWIPILMVVLPIISFAMIDSIGIILLPVIYIGLPIWGLLNLLDIFDLYMVYKYDLAQAIIETIESK